MGHLAEKIFVFTIGAIIGSFLNVCIHRMPANKSIISPPSHCPKCNKSLYWYDNIPVLSYIALLGRCRFCRERISVRYPVVELVTAFIMTVLFVIFGLTPEFFAYLVMTCGLIIESFIDWETKEISLQIVFGGIVAGMTLSFLLPPLMDSVNRIHALMHSIAGVIAGAGITFIVEKFCTFIFKKKVEELGEKMAMGSGDMYLMAMIGAFLGWKLVLLTFFIAPVLGIVPGTILSKGGSKTIPYVPFLSMAAMISVFFGNRILNLLSYGFF